MAKIKIGVLGATRGTELINTSLCNHPSAELVAICEKFEPLRLKTEELCRALGKNVVCYSNVDDFMSADMDAVVLANYANEHVPYAVRALLAGKHVLSEVMPVQTLAEAVQLCEAVEKSGKIYAYAENYCYFDAMFEMRLRYDRGDIGEATGAQAIFVNNLESRWPRLTRGERDNWRNLVPSTFYCSHSIGPMLFITGLRPVNVVGMEMPNLPSLRKLGARCGAAGMEVMELNNGAFACSIHGNISRMYLANCNIYGTKGTMETDRYEDNKLHVITETDASAWNNRYELNNIHTQTEVEQHRWNHEAYFARPCINGEPVSKDDRHGTALVMDSFIGTILGDETAKKYTIDVYQALDMGLPGLLAFRSIVNGSTPFTVPDFRNKEEREKYRYDYTCTDPKIASGDQLLPPCKDGNVDIPDEVYERVAEMFRQGIIG